MAYSFVSPSRDRIQLDSLRVALLINYASSVGGSFHQNFVCRRPSLLCARFIFSSTRDTGRIRSRSNSFITFAIMPVHTVNATFSKSVNWISIGRNSTLQPISEDSEGGGLNLRLFQFVDYKFSKCELPSRGGHLRNQAVQTPARCLSSTQPRKEEFEVTSSLP